MRVILTVGDLQPESGGPSRSVPALAVALADLGAFVSIVALRYRGDVAPLSTLEHERVRMVLVSCGGPTAKRFGAGGRFGIEVLDCCSAGKPVVLHDNGLWLGTNHASVRVARLTGVPLVVSPRGMLTSWSLQNKSWKKKLAWWLYQRRDLQSARVLHATSPDEAAGFRALGLRQPIAIIPNGVTLPGETRKSEIRNPKFEIRTALFLSRIHPKKGLIDLVAAWDAVRPPGWRVVIAGNDDGGHEQEVKATIRKLNLETSFEFIGEVADAKKSEVYRRADLFVLPTKSENFGIVIAEALACGVPVITTRGTPWEGLLTHRCGWWTDIGVEPLTAALREAMALSDGARREMGARGREWMERDFSWSGVAEQMKSVYSWMLGQGSQPSCVQTS